MIGFTIHLALTVGSLLRNDDEVNPILITSRMAQILNRATILPDTLSYRIHNIFESL